jgi:branched-chain amino acid transport system ATP-binding protein
VLEVIGTDTFYGESQILWGVSLKVDAGQVVALLGRNGMGKTTLVRSIMGLTPPRRGTIQFNERDITHSPSHRIARMGLALVPQGRHIFSSLTVRENVVFGMRGEGYSEESVYSYFPVLKLRAQHRGNQLSGGEQQMLAIARALLSNPKLVLMDEPSEGLAPIVIQTIGDIILKLKEKGLSILLVEQNVPLALKVSDYIYILQNGKVAHQCPKDELAGNTKLQSEYIGVSKYKE